MSDSLLEKTRERVKEGKAEGFTIFEDGSIRYKGRWCVPSTYTELKYKILTEAHNSKYSIHPGRDKMYQDLKQTVWWSGMKRDIVEFVSKCLTCQKVKSEHKRPAGLLQPLDIPVWKWDDIAMDFVLGLPRTKSGNDTLWVIVDRLTKSAKFIPMNNQWDMDQLARAYLKNIVRYHGVPRSIVSDRDIRYVSKFWEAFQKALGTELLRSTSFHPATVGQTERTNRTLEDMLRVVALDRQGSWDECLDMVEFSYNNSYQASIQMAPFEALYGRRCRNPVCWDDFSESVTLGPAMLEEMADQVKMIRERLKAAQDRQKSYADLKRRPDEFAVGDFVLLRVSPMKVVMRFGKRGKLSPKFIGPYEITEKVGKVAYRLALPNELGKVHDVFHISQLKRYVPDKSHVLDPEPLDLDENLSYEEKPIKILDSKVRSTRRKDIKMVKVLWANQRTQEATWETEDSMREKYPHLFS